MPFWFFVVTTHKIDGDEYTPEDILQTRFDDGFWGLGERTPNRKHLMKDDRVVFYMGLPRKEFVGSSTLASDSFRLTKDQLEKFGHDSDFYSAEYGVLLQDQEIWTQPIPADQVVDQLNFIENKEYWHSYFQGGVRKLNENDFMVITKGRDLSLSERIRTVEDIESESEFALEAHLEEFIDKNWDHIDFASRLEKYRAEDQTGRQFPADSWSIDFLCLDIDSGDLVVIELKRGKSSDSTVGQVLRYIGWVEEHISKKGQKVRGIIISREVDEALKYAIRGLHNVEVLTYKVDFELRPTR